MEFGLGIGGILALTFLVLWAVRITRKLGAAEQAAIAAAETSKAIAALVRRQTEILEATLVVEFEVSVVSSDSVGQRLRVASTSCNAWVHSVSFAGAVVRGRDIDGDRAVEAVAPVELHRVEGEYPAPLPVLLRPLEEAEFDGQPLQSRSSDSGFFGELCIGYSLSRDGEQRAITRTIESTEGLTNEVARQ